MARRRRAFGFSAAELAAVLVALALLLSIALPVLAGLRGDAGVQQSMANLIQMHVAHILYAADWDGRQVTWTRDDLGQYDSVGQYNLGCGLPFDPECHPPIIAGQDCEGAAWGYWPLAANALMFQPLVFPEDFVAGLGHWRMPNSRPFHLYLTGRYHDEIFYAPKDTTVLAQVADCIGVLCEFAGNGEDGFGSYDCNPGWSSYAFSAAALFHADVMRSNAAGGWQDPWGPEIDYGFQGPGFFQTTYPALKTLMLEHNWLQNPPGECNPAFTGCEPYHFNHGIDSAPVTLFYDGSVRLLPNAEVLFADFQVLSQTGGVDGLWHRGTPFGTNGYFIDAGFDFSPLSHHVLTTDGILGRDTLGGITAAALLPAPGWPQGPLRGRPITAAAQVLPAAPPPFSPEDQP